MSVRGYPSPSGSPRQRGSRSSYPANDGRAGQASPSRRRHFVLRQVSRSGYRRGGKACARSRWRCRGDSKQRPRRAGVLRTPSYQAPTRCRHWLSRRGNRPCGLAVTLTPPRATQRSTAPATSGRLDLPREGRTRRRVRKRTPAIPGGSPPLHRRQELVFAAWMSDVDARHEKHGKHQ